MMMSGLTIAAPRQWGEEKNPMSLRLVTPDCQPEVLSPADAARHAVVKKDPNIQQLESSLADRLGASVRLRPGRGGKGKLEISYNSLDELDGILEHIR